MSEPFDPNQPPPQPSGLPFEHLVFVAFNSRVFGLGRHTGQLVWEWKTPAGSGLPTLLLDGDRLIVSVQGYTSCLDPATGVQLWHNPLKGKSAGTACLASVRGGQTGISGNEQDIIAAQQAAAAAGS